MISATSVPSLPATAPKSSAIKAGWICLGLGALTFWIFGLGFVFFSVALIMGVVGMATNQVQKGIILLVSSLASLVICVVLFFALVIGSVGAAAKKATDDAKAKGQLRQTSYRK